MYFSLHWMWMHWSNWQEHIFFTWWCVERETVVRLQNQGNLTIKSAFAQSYCPDHAGLWVRWSVSLMMLFVLCFLRQKCPFPQESHQLFVDFWGKRRRKQSRRHQRPEDKYIFHVVPLTATFMKTIQTQTRAILCHKIYLANLLCWFLSEGWLSDNCPSAYRQLLPVQWLTCYPDDKLRLASVRAVSRLRQHAMNPFLLNLYPCLIFTNLQEGNSPELSREPRNSFVFLMLAMTCHESERNQGSLGRVLGPWDLIPWNDQRSRQVSAFCNHSAWSRPGQRGCSLKPEGSQRELSIIDMLDILETY